MVKKVKIVFVMLIIVNFWSCRQDEEPSFSESLFYGEWQDENSTNYRCSDGTGFSLWDSGNSSSFTWRVSGNKYYKVLASGTEQIYTILEAKSSIIRIEGQDGTIWNSYKVGDDGCYVPSTGEAIFWTSEDFSCGDVSVYVEGVYEGSITNYYSSETPECGSSGCVTVTRSAGTYDFNASCSSWTWSGEIIISNEGCYRMQLTSKKKSARI